MSVHDKDNSILKTCGTLTHFEFGFKVFKDEDLIVSLMNPETQELTALTLNEDYTVSISRINDGGAIELTETHEGCSLYAYRNIEIIQPHDIPTEGYFPESTIENALDRGIMIDQQQQEHLDRCIAIPGTSSFLGVNVLLPVPKPGNTLAWSEDGKSLENFDVKGSNDEFKSDVNNSITEIRSDMSSFKNDVNNSITDFKTDVDNKIIEVSEAATKINELEGAVQTATNSATIAKEQAGIATQKANEAIALNPADRDLSNLTEAGKGAIRNLQLPDVAEMTTALAAKVDSTNTQWAVNACMPDYSAGVSIPLNDNNGISADFIAPVDGYILFKGESQWGGATARFDLYKPDGTELGEWVVAAGEATQTYVASTGTFPLPKAYKCTVWCHRNPQIVFYPLKGAK